MIPGYEEVETQQARRENVIARLRVLTSNWSGRDGQTGFEKPLCRHSQELQLFPSNVQLSLGRLLSASVGPCHKSMTSG